MWIREDFLGSDERLEKVVVHGHTPTERPVLKPNRIGIDTGAYATNCLTAVKLTGESCIFLSTGDTQSLH
jgi:serine/threonine protein phosphatase 1